MIFLLSTTIITCSQGIDIINRLSSAIGLNYFQKIELIKIIKEHVPSCPIHIKSNEKDK